MAENTVNTSGLIGFGVGQKLGCYLILRLFALERDSVGKVAEERSPLQLVSR